MELSFEDARGRTGEVTEELDVEYDGIREVAVSDCVGRVVEDPRTDGDVAEQRAFDRLVVELPEAVPVREIERRRE